MARDRTGMIRGLCKMLNKLSRLLIPTRKPANQMSLSSSVPESPHANLTGKRTHVAPEGSLWWHSIFDTSYWPK